MWVFKNRNIDSVGSKFQGGGQLPPPPAGYGPEDWLVQVMNKPKLHTYVTFKSLPDPEKYLWLNCNLKYIQVVARFRCSSLPLATIDPRHRFCILRKSHDVEDEYHFLVHIWYTNVSL